MVELKYQIASYMDLDILTDSGSTNHTCCLDDSLDIKIVICGLLAGEERALQFRLVKVLNIPYETPSVGIGATQLIQFIV